MRTVYLIFALAFLLTTFSCARRTVTRTPTTVTVVKRPANYKFVRVNGKRYYVWNGNRYRKTKRGYVIVR